MRVNIFTTGTAPVGDQALALCYGSGLLTLKLPSIAAGAARFFAPPEVKRVNGICRARFALRRTDRFAVLPRGRPSGGVKPPDPVNVLVCTGATVTLWVTVWADRSKLPVSPDSARRGFCSRLAAQFLIRVNRPDTTPARGTGETCLARRTAQGKTTPVAVLLSPVARDHPSRALGPAFQLNRTATDRKSTRLNSSH